MAGSSLPSPHSLSVKVLTPKWRNKASSSRCHASCAGDGRGRGKPARTADADERDATRVLAKPARKLRREGMRRTYGVAKIRASQKGRAERASRKGEPKRASRKRRAE